MGIDRPGDLSRPFLYHNSVYKGEVYDQTRNVRA